MLFVYYTVLIWLLRGIYITVDENPAAGWWYSSHQPGLDHEQWKI